jgi:microcystin-dependent protein
MKRLFPGALALALFVAAPAADAAGLWPLSYTQRHDNNGRTYPGARAYFYDASTGDPIIVYREYSLATPHTNPVEADGNGVFPAVFVDGTENFYRFRVTTAAGAVLSDDATIPNIGPAEGEGGEPQQPVDEDGIAKTGDIKARYGVGTIVGWLPCSGQTVGSATSGSDYASNANEALFLYLWNADPNLVVVGGRGLLTAAQAWINGKKLTLPDMRGRVIAGLDNMGGSFANVLTGLDGLGEAAGVEKAKIAVNQVPQMSLANGLTDTESAVAIVSQISAANRSSGGDFGAWAHSSGNAGSGTIDTVPAHNHTVTGTVGTATGSQQDLSKVQPVVGLTFYIKL